MGNERRVVHLTKHPNIIPLDIEQPDLSIFYKFLASS